MPKATNSLILVLLFVLAAACSGQSDSDQSTTTAFDTTTTTMVQQSEIPEWHLIGTGDHEGLRLDLYGSSDGVIGTINPVG